MVDWNKPVQRRDGRAVRVLDICFKDKAGPILLAILNHRGDCEYISNRGVSGRWGKYDKDDPYDIINVPAKLMSLEDWVHDGMVTHSRRVSVEVAQAYGNYRAKFKKENSND